MRKAIIFAGLMIFATGQTILFTLLGPAAREIGLSEVQVGAIITASAVVFVLISPFWGRLADRWGRKNVIVTGLASYSLATLLFAWLLNLGIEGMIGGLFAFFVLVAARLLYALGSGGIQPAAIAIMADITSSEDRSAGVAAVGAAFGLGTVLGPAIAYAFVGWGLLVPLLVAAGSALLIAVLATVLISDPPRRENTDAQSGGRKVPLRSIAPALFIAMGTFVAVSAMQQTTAFFIQDFTDSTAVETVKLAGNAFVTMAIAMLVIQGGVVQKLKPSPEAMLTMGFPIAIFGISTIALAPSYAVILIGFALVGAGFGFVQPGISAFVSLSTGGASQGTAAGYVQAAMAGGFVIGPLAGTAIYSLTPIAPFLLAIACCLLCLILFGWVVRSRLLGGE